MLTAEENILLPLSIAGEKPDPSWYEDLIRSVGLGDRLHHRPAELSAASSSASRSHERSSRRPRSIFADEPTGNLDSKTSGEILELLRASVASLGQTMVMVTHDARAARSPTASSSSPTGPSSRIDQRGETRTEILASMEELGTE